MKATKLLIGAFVFINISYLEANRGHNRKYDTNTRFYSGNMPYYSHYSRYYNVKGIQTTNTPYTTNGYYYGDGVPETLIFMPDQTNIVIPFKQDWPGVEEAGEALEADSE